MTYQETIAAAPTSPALETLAEARSVVIGDLTADEYALARVIASEHSRGSPTELCCIGDADLNKSRASGRGIVDHITAGTGVFGSQGTAGATGRKRPVSSARPPGPRHVQAAIALIRPRLFGFFDPPARGVSRGARRYFDPRSQLASHKTGDPDHCHPLVILERWTYALPWANGATSGRAADCKLGTKRGNDQEEWCGPIPGVDAWELMLMRPSGRQQDALYAAARKLIESNGTVQSGPSPIAPLVELLVVIAIAAAAAALMHGAGGALV